MLIYGFYALFSAFLLSIPILNRHVLGTVNLEQIKSEARTHIDSINYYQEEGLYSQMRDYCLMVDSLYGKRKDPPSQYLSQLAFFNVGISHQLAAEYEESVAAFEQMLERYPVTVFAEQLFFMAGQSMIHAKNYQEAIRWFERLEMNRELSLSFPKYKNRELKPEIFVNLDVLGRKKEDHVRIYTNEQRKAESKGKKEDEGGNLYSDAVVKIGECYLALGKSDSARAQFKIISEYFPDSDQLDDIQMFIADSYFNDGERYRKDTLGLPAGEEKQALLKRAEGEYLNAEREYWKFINRFGESELASKGYIQLGAVRFALNDSKGGEKVFSDAISSLKVIEKQAQVQLEIGNYYNRDGIFPKAIAAYNKVVQNYPDTKYAGNAQFLSGVMYEEQLDTAKAMRAFELVAENYKNSPFFPEAAYRLAKKHLNLKDYQNAEKYFTQIVVTNPNHVVAARSWFEMALLNIERKEWLEAIRKFEFSIGGGISAISDQAALKIAECWRALGDQARADEALGKIKDETLRDELYWEEQGSKEVPTKKLEKIALNLAEKKDAKDRAFWFEQRSGVLLEIKKPDSALAAMDSSIFYTKDKLKGVSLKLAKARILASPALNRFAEARLLLKSVLDTRGLSALQRARIQYDIADAFRKEGLQKESLAGFGKIVDAYVKSEDEKEKELASQAQLQIARMHDAAKNHVAALLEYEKFMLAFPGSEFLLEAIFGAGNARIAQGEGKKAVDFILAKTETFKGTDVVKNSRQRINFQVADLFATRLANQEGDATAYPKAEEYYFKALKEDTLSTLYSASAYGLGINYLRWGAQDGKQRTAEAEAAFLKVRKDHSSYYKAAKNELSKIEAKRDWRKAVANLDEAVVQSSKDYESFKAREAFEDAENALRETVIAIMAVGNIYMERKMHVEAAQKFVEVFDEYPEADSSFKAVSMMQAIDNMSQANKLDEMKKLTGRMVKEHPHSPYTVNALYVKANAYYQRGMKNASQFSLAHAAFLEAISFMEKKPALSESESRILEVAYYQKADCLLFAKKFAQSVKEYDLSLAKFPSGTYRCISIFQQGNAYWSEQKWDLASKKYELAHRTCSQDGFNQYCKNMGLYGYTLEQTDKTGQASKLYKDCKSACKSKPDDYKFCHEGSQRLLIVN